MVHSDHSSIRDIEPQVYWGYDLDFFGHVTSLVTWPLDSRWAIFMGSPLRPCVHLVSSYGALNVGRTNARTDGRLGDFIVCPTLCIALDGQ